MTHLDPTITGGFELKAARRMATSTLPINVPRLVTWLQALVIIILGLGVLREFIIAAVGTETVLKDLRHFSLDAERSMETWYETVTMAASALLLCVIAALSRFNDTANRWHWTLLAGIFFAMSIDSAVSFHEVTVAPLRNAFHLSGIFYFSWVLLAAPLVAAVGLYFIPFLVRLPRQTAMRFIIAGSVFVGGALGTEFVCGYLATSVGMDSTLYQVTAAGEECLEAIGMTIFVTALLRHLGEMVPLLRLDFHNDPV